MNENFAKKTRPTINYLVTLVFYIVIFIATILSVLIETGHSTSLSIGWFDFICPIFLRSKIIFETMKIIGFASLFIGFIQANLDKTILGLKNTDLLLFKFKGYGVFTAFHFAFTIACIMFSATKLSQSAFCTFIAVIFGLVYQWRAFVCVILNSNKRVECAVSYWREELKKEKEVLQNIKQLIDTLPESKSKSYEIHIECIAYAINVYVDNQQKRNEHLRDLASIWSELIDSSSNSFKDIVVADLFGAFLQNTPNKKTDISIITSAYFVQQVRENVEIVDYKIINDSFYILSEKMIYLVNDLKSKSNEATIDETLLKIMLDSILTNIYSLSWIYMMFGNMSIDKRLLRMVPESVDFTYVKEIAYILKPGIDKEKDMFDTAINVAQEQLLLVWSERNEKSKSDIVKEKVASQRF